MSELLSNDYKGQPVNVCQGQHFKPYNRIGFATIKVLKELYGKQWDDYALGLIHCLRPTTVRVVTDGVQLDCRCWRVTVWITKDNVISNITQEVQVGLPKDLEGASASLFEKLNIRL